MDERVKILFLITTYNRPDMLLELLSDIKKQVKCSYKIKIYNDCSQEDYAPVKEYLKKEMKNYSYRRMEENYGRKRYWELHKIIFKELKNEDFKYFIQIPDDVTLVDEFYPKVIDRFKACGASALNIMIGKSLDRQWEKKGQKQVKINGISYWKRRWLDLCYVTNKEFFKKLNYNFPSIPSDWFRQRDDRSSGAGTALTLVARGSILVVRNSLVIHKGVDSVMNPGKHRGRPLRETK